MVEGSIGDHIIVILANNGSIRYLGKTFEWNSNLWLVNPNAHKWRRKTIMIVRYTIHVTNII